MKIVDLITKKELSTIGILLKTAEARELRDGIDEILGRKVEGDHVHVSCEDYKKEITIALEDKCK